MLNIPKEFELKLKEKGAYEKFIKNYNDQYDFAKAINLDLSRYDTFLEYVCHAFIFEATPEGIEYWLNVATMDEN